MSLLGDGNISDSAIKSDWLAAVNRALNDEVNANLELHK
jgi:hypothetical protein